MKTRFKIIVRGIGLFLAMLLQAFLAPFKWVCRKFVYWRLRPARSTLLLSHAQGKLSSVQLHQLDADMLRRGGLSPLFMLLFCVAILCGTNANGQLTATYSSNMLTAPLALQTTSSNLLTSQYNTNRIWQGRHLGIGMSFVGGSATNTGTIGFKFGVVYGGANGYKTTTTPFVITSTVNGTTPVIDWAVLPNYTAGPADSLVLLGITNAAVNVNPAGTNGSVYNVQVWLQTDTRP